MEGKFHRIGSNRRQSGHTNIRQNSQKKYTAGDKERHCIMTNRAIEWEAETMADFYVPNNRTPGYESRTVTDLKEETHKGSSKKVQYSIFTKRTPERKIHKKTEIVKKPLTNLS